MTRSLRPVVLGFIDTAPVAHTLHLELAASTEQVYAMLSDSPATWTWMPSVKGGRWLGTDRRVDARREITIGPATITETILAAEPAQRWAYRIDTSSVPMASALLEDWRLSEVPATSTRPTSTKAEYTFYIDPLRFTGPAARAMGFGLSRVAAKAETNLNRIFASEKH